jgi:undecaprenyl diphosphate synthase
MTFVHRRRGTFSYVSIPRHVAVIPDGNRRWARARGLPAAEGHAAGVRAIGSCAEAAFEEGVEVFTFWWGSPANLTQRDPAEVGAIVDTLSRWLSTEGAALVARMDATFEAIGRWWTLCPAIEPAVEKAARAAGPGPRRLVLLMAYDGREEIVDAARRLAGAGRDAFTVEEFGRSTWTGHLPPVDLVVRTGGDPHLSAGFLIWGIADAALSFSDEMWPDFGPDRMRAAIRDAAAMERRFGR